MDRATKMSEYETLNSLMEWSESAQPDEPGKLPPEEFEELLEELQWLKEHFD